MHRRGDALVPVEAGRYLAWKIPGASYFELPGDDHLLQAFDLDVLGYADRSHRRVRYGARGWRLRRHYGDDLTRLQNELSVARPSGDKQGKSISISQFRTRLWHIVLLMVTPYIRG